MSDPFVAEIRMSGFNFAPKGWARCNGQILPLSQNTALFSLLGTTYGGDGKSNFALPNMLDSVPMQPGQGPGLSLRDLGEQSGSETVTLLVSEMPVHSHGIRANNDDPATSLDPTNNLPGRPGYDDGSTAGVGGAYTTLAGDTPMNPNTLSIAGGSLPHNNMQPTMAVNFCIALQGVFPPRP